jgi:hypothetical protein
LLDNFIAARGGIAALCHVHAQIFAGGASDEFVTGWRRCAL